jgi:hypothetical protein
MRTTCLEFMIRASLWRYAQLSLMRGKTFGYKDRDHRGI